MGNRSSLFVERIPVAFGFSSFGIGIRLDPRHRDSLRRPTARNSDLPLPPILAYAVDAMGKPLVVMEAGNSGSGSSIASLSLFLTGSYQVIGETGASRKDAKKSTVLLPCVGNGQLRL